MSRKPKELLVANRLTDLYERYIRYVDAMIEQKKIPITFKEWKSP